MKREDLGEKCPTFEENKDEYRSGEGKWKIGFECGGIKN